MYAYGTLHKCIHTIHRKASGDMMPVCEDCRDRVDECYQKNNSKPLLCSSVVREYVECVEKYRRVRWSLLISLCIHFEHNYEE